MARRAACASWTMVRLAKPQNKFGPGRAPATTPVLRSRTSQSGRSRIAQALLDDLAAKRRQLRVGPRARVRRSDGRGRRPPRPVLCRGRAEARQVACALGQHLAGRQEAQSRITRVWPLSRDQWISRGWRARAAAQRARRAGTSPESAIRPSRGRTPQQMRRKIQRRTVPQADRGDVQDVREDVRRPPVALPAGSRQTVSQAPTEVAIAACGRKARRSDNRSAMRPASPATNACNGTSIVATPRSFSAWR